jgi:hypothetical protein
LSFLPTTLPEVFLVGDNSVLNSDLIFLHVDNLTHELLVIDGGMNPLEEHISGSLCFRQFLVVFEQNLLELILRHFYGPL